MLSLHLFRTRRVLVLTAAALVSFIVGGSCSVAVGLFLQPLLVEFHWPNGLTSGIATAFTLATLLSAPLAGALLDKYGARILMTGGLIVAASGFLLARYAHSVQGMFVAFVLAGIGNCAAFYVPVSVVTTSWMGERKSLGMGIVLGATSAGAAVASVLISWGIEHYGWRIPLEADAALIAAMLPVVMLMIESAPESSTVEREERSKSIDSTARAMMVSPTFLMGAAAGALFNVGMASIYYHVVSVLAGAGYSAYSAGIMLGMTWILSAIGSLFFGSLADRRGACSVLAYALLCCALGTAFLSGANSAYWGPACVAGFVLMWGSTANSVSQFLPVIFAERFGQTHLGTLLGVQSGVAGIASAAAPVITGMLYDKFNNYHVAILFSVSATLLAALLMALLHATKSNDGAVMRTPAEN